MGVLQIRVGLHLFLDLVLVPLDDVLTFLAVYIEPVELVLCALADAELRWGMCVLVLSSGVVYVVEDVVVESRIQDGIEDVIAFGEIEVVDLTLEQ